MDTDAKLAAFEKVANMGLAIGRKAGLMLLPMLTNDGELEIDIRAELIDLIEATQDFDKLEVSPE